MARWEASVVALTGGVGGAKLVWGLAQLLPPEQLTVIANTGDDFRHLALTICPDLDTQMYTLAALVNPDTGWGLAGDTFGAMRMLARYGGPGWFKLGDGDLATHLMRTELLRTGRTLTQAAVCLCQGLGVEHRLLPMTDQDAPTVVDTDEGCLPFQEWFVRRRWLPAVREVVLPEPPPAATPEVIAALNTVDLVIIPPSNPLVSVAPILHVREVGEMLRDLPVVAVSPIIGGKAVRGPAAKMMAELGMEVTPVGVARFYGPGLLDGFVLDEADATLAPEVEALGIPALVAPTWMRSQDDRIRLAEVVLDWGSALIERG